MATRYWLGTADSYIDDPDNWDGSTLPEAGDDLVFDASHAGWTQAAAQYDGGLDNIAFGTVTANDGSNCIDGVMSCVSVILTNGSTVGLLTDTVVAGSVVLGADSSTCRFNGTCDTVVAGGGSTVAGTVHFSATFNDTSVMQATTWSGATVTFNNSASSSSSGGVNGTVTYSDLASNAGSVNGNIIFNDSTANAGFICGNIIFNGNSANNGQVVGSSVWNDSSVNNTPGSGLYGLATFNDQSVNTLEAQIIGVGYFADPSFGNPGGALTIIGLSSPTPLDLGADTPLPQPASATVDLRTDSADPQVIEFGGTATVKIIRNVGDTVYYTIDGSPVGPNNYAGRVIYKTPIAVTFSCTISIQSSNGNTATVRVVNVG